MSQGIQGLHQRLEQQLPNWLVGAPAVPPGLDPAALLEDDERDIATLLRLVGSAALAVAILALVTQLAA